ncbi:pro-resilin-like [Bacillus rossius redtenbacheri]|uniref:pro-resilin-like n=1 Tax=Bacillus rossius redtenbacheri TaxID=93214 RepID=UPI002FDD8206
MAKVSLSVVIAIISCVVAEPPVGRQYLPPAQRNGGLPFGSLLSGRNGALSARYGAPSPSAGAFGRGYNSPLSYNSRLNIPSSISTQYGVPSGVPAATSAFNAFNAPVPAGPLAGPAFLSAQYGAPAASSRFGGVNGLSTQYGAPAASSRFGGLNGLSAQYGEPAASSRFGGVNGLSTQYGAPAASSRFGGVNGLSTQYGAPAASSRFGGVNGLSAQYGEPAASSRFGGVNGLSTQYGAPAAGRSGLANTYGAPADFSRNSGLPAAQYGAPLAGYSAQEDPLAEPANYQFSYAVQDEESGSEFGQEETRQLETAQGSYRVLLPDGRLQVVEYQADEEGYKPEVRYEETAVSRGAGGPYPASRALQGPY